MGMAAALMFVTNSPTTPLELAGGISGVAAFFCFFFAGAMLVQRTSLQYWRSTYGSSQPRSGIAKGYDNVLRMEKRAVRPMFVLGLILTGVFLICLLAYNL
jgi:hypothetical protein